VKRSHYINFVFAFTVGIRILAEFIPFGSAIKNPIWLLVISQFILIVPSVGYLFYTRQSYPAAVGLKKLSPVNVILLVGFTLCMSPIMALINAFSRLYAEDATTNIMSGIAMDNPFLLSLLCIAVIPAVLEESVYRGILYQEYRKINPFGAIFFSALLFGLLHGNLNQFTYAFVMGIIMAFVIEATDSILATMIIHFITNGMSVVVLYATRNMSNYDELINKAKETGFTNFVEFFQAYGVPAVIGGVIGFFIYIQLAKNSNRLEHIKGLFHRRSMQKEFCPPIRSLITLPLIIAIGICIFIIIMNELMLRGMI
jgi:membrane protease YdiL (CAAX protease family)